MEKSQNERRERSSSLREEIQYNSALEKKIYSTC